MRFGSVSVHFGSVSGPSWGVGSGQGGVVARGVCKGTNITSLATFRGQKPHPNSRNTKTQGRTNPAFPKPCLCMSDTRHFHHFRLFRGLEERNPCFQLLECKFVSFSRHFRQNGLFAFGRGQKHGLPKTRFTKTRFTKTKNKHRVCTNFFEQIARPSACFHVT